MPLAGSRGRTCRYFLIAGGIQRPLLIVRARTPGVCRQTIASCCSRLHGFMILDTPRLYAGRAFTRLTGHSSWRPQGLTVGLSVLWPTIRKRHLKLWSAGSHRQVHFRAAGWFREVFDSAAAGLPLMREALRLFEGTATAEHAQAWYGYAYSFLFHGGGYRGEILAALERALDVAEAAGAATLIPRILCGRAMQSFLHGEVEEGFRLLARARQRRARRRPRAAFPATALADPPGRAAARSRHVPTSGPGSLRPLDHPDLAVS
jgi:hypothetical protein